MPHQREPQAEARMVPIAPVLALPEALKDVREHGPIDAGACIRHRNDEIVRVEAKAGGDDPSAGRELHGIGEQVPEHLLDAVGINDHDGAAGENIALQPNALRLGAGPNDVERGVDDRDDVVAAAVETGLAGRDPRDVEHVRHELRKHFAVSLDHFRGTFVRALVDARRPQDARVAQDRVQRRAQLVRQVGHEFFFRSVSLFELPQHSLLLGDVARDLGRADDLSAGRMHRRHRQRHLDEAPVLPHPDGLVMIDAFPGPDLRQHFVLFTLAIRRDDAADRAADHFVRGVAEHSLGRAIPCLDDPIQVLTDDGVVGRLDDRGKPDGSKVTGGRDGTGLHNVWRLASRTIVAQARLWPRHGTSFDLHTRGGPRMRWKFTLFAVLVAFVSPATAQVQSRPTDPPLVTAANESWYMLGEPVQFAGDLYSHTGPPVFFNGNTMVRSGHYNGIPLYTDTTVEPFSVVLVPISRGLMQPYTKLRRDVAPPLMAAV